MSLSPDAMRPLLPSTAPEQAETARAPKTRQEALKQQDQYWGDDGLTFADFLDIINPLQHIPGVSTLYRNLTGDEISEGARIVGGAAYGGPLGLISAVTDAVIAGETGKDIADHVVTALSGPEPETTQLAELPAPTPVAAPLPYSHKVALPPAVKSEPLPQLTPEVLPELLSPLPEIAAVSDSKEQVLPWARQERDIVQASSPVSWVTQLEYLPAPGQAAAAYQASAQELPWLKESPEAKEYLEAGQPELPVRPYTTA